LRTNLFRELAAEIDSLVAGALASTGPTITVSE
jgi:hypothetical protein